MSRNRAVVGAELCGRWSRIVRSIFPLPANPSEQAPAITLRIVGHDDIGIVTNITSIINKESDILLRSISIDSHDGLFSGMLTVMVDDTGKLEALIKKIKTVKGVKQVNRG